MKNFSLATILSLLFLVTIFINTGCEKSDEEDIAPVLNDSSLIIASSGAGRYMIVSPSTGIDRVEVTPDLINIATLALGYQSEKAIILGKEPGGTGTNLIYTCDRKTGENIFEVTSKDDWDVLFVDAAKTGPQLVFSAQNVDQYSDDNIHRINENGTGYQRLSSPDENVNCLGVACFIWSAYDPAWSPDGTQIAFDIHLREVDELHPHNSICIMNEDGTNKQVLYDKNVEEAQYTDICFTQNGEFIIFCEGLANSTTVKVLDISSQSFIDITNDLIVDGLHPTDIWTSPNEDKIIFNKYEPGGGDLYVIEFSTEGDDFTIEGEYKVMAANHTGIGGYGIPYWQLFEED